MVRKRRRLNIERRDSKEKVRTTGEPGRAGVHVASEKVSLDRALFLLTEEERLVLIWKKAGFSDREIAKHLSRTPSAVREVRRSSVSKIHRSLYVTPSTTSDDSLPLNCPICGIRLDFRGRVNDRRTFTCAVHGGYHIGPTGHFRRTDG